MGNACMKGGATSTEENALEATRALLEASVHTRSFYNNNSSVHAKKGPQSTPGGVAARISGSPNERENSYILSTSNYFKPTFPRADFPHPPSVLALMNQSREQSMGNIMSTSSAPDQKQIQKLTELKNTSLSGRSMNGGGTKFAVNFVEGGSVHSQYVGSPLGTHTHKSSVANKSGKSSLGGSPVPSNNGALADPDISEVMALRAKSRRNSFAQASGRGLTTPVGAKDMIKALDKLAMEEKMAAAAAASSSQPF